MKKLFLFVLAIIPFNFINAQAILEHQYQGIIWTYHLDNYGYVYTEGFVATDSALKIYSKEHVLLKTIQIAEPNYTLGGLWNVSDHLFNSDDKVEVLYGAWGGSTGGAPKLILKNEDGVILQTFPNVAWPADYPRIYNFDSEFKLMIMTTAYVVDVYSLPGSTIFDVPEDRNQDFESSSFPNPTDKIVNIKYPQGSTEIDIFNISGHRVHSVSVAGSGIEMVNTSSFPNGCYLYKIIGNQKEIGSGKFLISR